MKLSEYITVLQNRLAAHGDSEIGNPLAFPVSEQDGASKGQFYAVCFASAKKLGRAVPLFNGAHGGAEPVQQWVFPDGHIETLREGTPPAA